MAAERAARHTESPFQRRRRRDKRLLQVKIGHGGTLDPLATGVLVIGIGKGTRQLARFLECTKSYETTMLVGAATDTHDILGKVLARSQVEHVSRVSFEKALQDFRGHIEQKPPLYSAIRMEGKRLYEYAREGLELPAEIQRRAVVVESLEVIQWLEPGSHCLELPRENRSEVGTSMASRILDHEGSHRRVTTDVGPFEHEPSDHACTSRAVSYKWRDSNAEATADEAPAPVDEEGYAQTSSTGHDTTGQTPTSSRPSGMEPTPLAVTLRMTVSSGFYVRSLCHDLGKAVGSLAVMASLSRTRQGDFELGRNVLEYDDVTRGEEVWGPKVQLALEQWSAAQKAF